MFGICLADCLVLFIVVSVVWFAGVRCDFVTCGWVVVVLLFMVCFCLLRDVCCLLLVYIASCFCFTCCFGLLFTSVCVWFAVLVVGMVNCGCVFGLLLCGLYLMFVALWFNSVVIRFVMLRYVCFDVSVLLFGWCELFVGCVIVVCFVSLSLVCGVIVSLLRFCCLVSCLTAVYAFVLCDVWVCFACCGLLFVFC